MPGKESEKIENSKKVGSKDMASDSKEKKRVDIETLIGDMEAEPKSKVDFFDLLGEEKEGKEKGETEENLEKAEQEMEKPGIEKGKEEPDKDIGDESGGVQGGSFFDLIGAKGGAPLKKSEPKKEAPKAKEEPPIDEMDDSDFDDEIIVSKKMQEDLKKIQEEKGKADLPGKKEVSQPVEGKKPDTPRAFAPEGGELISSIKSTLENDIQTSKELGKFIEILSKAAEDDPLEEAVGSLGKKLDQVNNNTKQITILLGNLQSRLDSMLGIEEKPQFQGLGEETRRVAVEVDMLPSNSRISMTELARRTNMKIDVVEGSIKDMISNSWKIEITDEEIKLMGILSKKKKFVYKNY